MRIKEFEGYVHMVDQISPEAFRAQRQAELVNLVRFNPEKMQLIRDWNEPEKREAIKARVNDEMAHAQAALEGKTVWLRPPRELTELLTVVPVVKAPPPKPTFLESLRYWLGKIGL